MKARGARELEKGPGQWIHDDILIHTIDGRVLSQAGSDSSRDSAMFYTKSTVVAHSVLQTLYLRSNMFSGCFHDTK